MFINFLIFINFVSISSGKTKFSMASCRIYRTFIPKMFQFTSIWGHLIKLQMPRSVLPSNGSSCCLTRNESHKNHSAVVYCTTSLSVTIIEGSKLIWMPVHKTRKKWSRRQSICDVVIIIITRLKSALRARPRCARMDCPIP